MMCSRWMNGTRKTLPPITTFWPDRSWLIPPCSVRISLPFEPVMINASLGPATRHRETTISPPSTSRMMIPITEITMVGNDASTADSLIHAWLVLLVRRDDLHRRR